MNFIAPQMWWLAPVALLGALIALIAWYRQKQIISAWGSPDNVTKFARPIRHARFTVKGAALTVGLLAAVFALARPYIPNARVAYPAGTVDVIVITDVSRSMGAQDCQGQSRLTTARQCIAGDIIPAIKHNQLGIITYSGEAAASVYLTDQLETVSWLVDNELTISSAPGHGSAMGDAFDLAFRFFDGPDSHPSRKKLLILFSDGGTDDNTDLAKIGAECRKRNIHVIVAATGLTTPSLIPVEELSSYDRMTATGRFYKIGDKPAQTALDAQTLGRLSDLCEPNSVYLPVTSAADFQLAPLTSPLEPRYTVGKSEIYFYPCLVFLVLLSIASVSTARASRERAQRDTLSTKEPDKTGRFES